MARPVFIGDESALTRAKERFDEMLTPAHIAGDPTHRAKQIAEGIDRYYDGGQESCLIVALSYLTLS